MQASTNMAWHGMAWHGTADAARPYFVGRSAAFCDASKSGWQQGVGRHTISTTWW